MIVHDHEQNSPEWYSARMGLPTASEFSKIVTAVNGRLSSSSGAYIDELIAQRLAPSEFGEAYASASMDRGHQMESRARAAYEFATGNSVEQVGFCLSDCRRCGASPDGLVGEDGCIEIKSPMAKTHLGYYRDGGLPSAYRQQVHGVLAVTGRQWCDFVAFHPELPLFIHRIERDDYTVKLQSAVAEFCDKLDAAAADMMATLKAEGFEIPAEKVVSE